MKNWLFVLAGFTFIASLVEGVTGAVFERHGDHVRATKWYACSASTGTQAVFWLLVSQIMGGN